MSVLLCRHQVLNTKSLQLLQRPGYMGCSMLCLCSAVGLTCRRRKVQRETAKSLLWLVCALGAVFHAITNEPRLLGGVLKTAHSVPVCVTQYCCRASDAVASGTGWTESLLGVHSCAIIESPSCVPRHMTPHIMCLLLYTYAGGHAVNCYIHTCCTSP